MSDTRTEGSMALDLLIEAATSDGYAKGYWTAERNLADWREGLSAKVDRWSAVNPEYVDWPECAYGLFALAVADEGAYGRLVGEVVGGDPKSYEGLCGIFGFLHALSDDHDFTIDPRGEEGARVTFDGPIGVDGVRGATPGGLWRHLEPLLRVRNDPGIAPKGF